MTTIDTRTMERAAEAVATCEMTVVYRVTVELNGAHGGVDVTIEGQEANGDDVVAKVVAR